MLWTLTTKMSQTDEQVVELVSAALESAMELANDEDGWKVEKEQGEATLIYIDECCQC